MTRTLRPPHVDFPTFFFDSNLTMKSSSNTKTSSARSKSLGKQVVGWTHNLIASAIVLMVMLTFGFQIVRSWYPGSPAIEGVIPQASLAQGPTVELELGKAGGSWTRIEFAGTREEMLVEMIEMTRHEIESNRIHFHDEPDTSWNTLSKQLQNQEFAWSDALGHRVYMQDGPIPLAVACRVAVDRATSAASKNESLLVGCWTLALPGGRMENVDPELPGVEPALVRSWTLIVCHPQSTNSQNSSAVLSIPQRFRTIYSVTDGVGHSMVKFVSDLTLVETRNEMIQHWRDQGWAEVEWSDMRQVGEESYLQGHCQVAGRVKIRVDLNSTGAGTQGLITDQP